MKKQWFDPQVDEITLPQENILMKSGDFVDETEGDEDQGLGDIF